MFRAGDWLGAWTGTVVAAQRFVREFRPDDHSSIESAALAAWEATLPACPAPVADNWRSIDVDVLLVGPSGVVRLNSMGSIHRLPKREDGTILGVIGCADEYVTGWMDYDRDGPIGRTDAEDAIRAACRRYPGVGLPVESYERVGEAVTLRVDGFARASIVGRAA